MKVLVITSRYPSENNPYNHMFVHIRCVEMLRQGINLEVFVPSDQYKNFVFEGVEVRMLPSKEIVKHFTMDKVLYLHLLNIYPFSSANGWVIYKYILKHNLPFAMYIHGNEVQKYTSRIYEFNYRIKDVLKWIKKDVFVIPKMKYFVGQTSKIGNKVLIFPSKWMKEEMERNLNCKISRFEIIPNGIDTSFFSYQNHSEYRFKLLTIRSLSSKVYDIEKTIEVMSHLPERFTLDIYGQGVYIKKYQKLINKKRLDNRVKIIPTFVEKEEMRNLFRNYGIFISTTKMDSQGITMMEAISAGLLVVTTDNSSKREFLVHKINGILGKSPKEIADRICEACNNEIIFSELTKNGRASMEQIDIQKTVELEIKTLSKLIINF